MTVPSQRSDGEMVKYEPPYFVLMIEGALASVSGVMGFFYYW